MGALKESLLSALPYMPEHRALNQRSKNLTLDALLDEGRRARPLAPGTLDLILMGYRYQAVFRKTLDQFSKKPLKPRKIEDLLLVVFAALLSRDKTPAHALVSEGVDAAKEAFGPHTSSIVNAFLRRVAERRDTIREELEANPLPLMGEELSLRWKGHPALLERAASLIARRPEAGITAFNAAGDFKVRLPEEIRDSNRVLQAMDPGSWGWMQALMKKIETKKTTPLRILDACAAPGGKLIALSTLLTLQGRPFELFATDVSYPRVERLRENLQRWNLKEISTELQDWSYEASPAAAHFPPFDLILVDLPCSGSGTLASRPDALTTDLSSRIKELIPLQEKILNSLKTRLANDGILAVSVCSVDPEEISAITHCLGTAPFFSSWKEPDMPDFCEGIEGWWVPARS